MTSLTSVCYQTGNTIQIKEVKKLVLISFLLYCSSCNNETEINVQNKIVMSNVPNAQKRRACPFQQEGAGSYLSYRPFTGFDCWITEALHIPKGK